MRVIAPHTRLDERTMALLDSHAKGWVGIKLDPAQPTAYQRILAQEWSTPGDLVIVEHDIGIHAGVIPGFDDCPEPWCGHAYPIGEQLLMCLGCTRFRDELKQTVPDLFTRIDALPYDGSPAQDWRRMDVRLAGVLMGLGHTPHTHGPPVEHYHIYPQA